MSLPSFYSASPEPHRGVAKKLANVVAFGQRQMTPELVVLGYEPLAVGRFDRFDFGVLPAEVRQRAFFV